MNMTELRSDWLIGCYVLGRDKFSSKTIFTNNLSSERVDSKGLMGDEGSCLWAPRLIYYYFTLISRTREQHESLGYFGHCTHTAA